MRKFFRTFLMCMLLAVTLTVSAYAVEDTLKVGLYYGSNALFSANLQNFRGSGYELGWFDELTRDFVSIGYLDEEKISMTADGNIYISGGSYYSTQPSSYTASVGGYHVQLTDVFYTFDEAKYVADQFRSGFVAFINNEYRVRVNNFLTRDEAEVAAATYATYTWYDMWGGVHGFVGQAVQPSSTAVTITVTTADTVLFEFDCSGAKQLGILPRGGTESALTWFKGYKWYGGFEYRRSTGGNINVINVVNIDDYVKGVLPYEMTPSWPLEALKAQAVCARTYAKLQTKHYNSYKFDVCNTTCCQMYLGANQASALTDQAAVETAGIVATYNGVCAETYYYASNGGASENSENVWNDALPYLRGKEDPFEATISIPGYTYEVSYTFSELTRLLQSKGYSIGDVCGCYVSKTTPTGNVLEITFVDTAGKTLTISKEKCRTVLSTSMFGDTRSVKSMRFTITGGSGGSKYHVNSAGNTLSFLRGLFAIFGLGTTQAIPSEEVYVITSSGLEALQDNVTAPPSTGITITGTGSGHNVGMSQCGAKAMAELGYTYTDILNFYFTGISLESVGLYY